MAFVLHHSQMARSVNPYATTLYYAQFLQDMSKIDEGGETSDIPGCGLLIYNAQVVIVLFCTSTRCSCFLKGRVVLGLYGVGSMMSCSM